jgi:hypothetical protein
MAAESGAAASKPAVVGVTTKFAARSRRSVRGDDEVRETRGFELREEAADDEVCQKFLCN